MKTTTLQIHQHLMVNFVKDVLMIVIVYGKDENFVVFFIVIGKRY